jgi:hypothetical protein
MDMYRVFVRDLASEDFPTSTVLARRELRQAQTACDPVL